MSSREISLPTPANDRRGDLASDLACCSSCTCVPLRVVPVVVAVAPAQARPQLVRHDLDGRAGAAVLGRPAPLLEPIHDHVWFEVRRVDMSEYEGRGTG